VLRWRGRNEGEVMSKKIDLSIFTEDHISAVINILQYIKSHPGHLDKIIDVLDDGIVELQYTDSLTPGTLTLKSGEVVLELEHNHSKWCYDCGQDTCNASNMTRTRKV